jgi:hypothetical protein
MASDNGRCSSCAEKNCMYVSIALLTILVLGFSFPQAYAASKTDKDCKAIQFHTFESNTSITVRTLQDEYSIKMDYFQDTGGFIPDPYFKNIAANDDLASDVSLLGGETITVTFRTVEEISNFGTYVTLYDNKVSDCEILLVDVKEKDRVDFEIVDIQQIDEFTVQLSVLVPDASIVDKDFTKLVVEFPSTPESTEYYIVSHSVQVS